MRRRDLRTAGTLATLTWLTITTVALAAGPPFPSPTPDQSVYDTADVLLPSTRNNAQQIAESIRVSSGSMRRT